MDRAIYKNKKLQIDSDRNVRESESDCAIIGHETDRPLRHSAARDLALTHLQCANQPSNLEGSWFVDYNLFVSGPVNVHPGNIAI